MHNEKRKELINNYKNKPVTGGVYCIICSGNQHKWIRPTVDMESAKSKYIFSQKIRTCPEPAMRRDSEQYGIESFSFICLEELKKDETQTDKEFASDIQALYEIWAEKDKQGELNIEDISSEQIINGYLK